MTGSTRARSGGRPPRVEWWNPFARYERMREPLLPWSKFFGRLARGVLVAATLILGSLAVGVLGYHGVARLSWIDSILNASMILTGMGPVDRMETVASKLFASAYALFSGVAFLSSVGLLLAPVVHRFLHRFHLEAEDDAVPEPPARAREG